CLALSPDGKMVAAGGYSPSVSLWSTVDPGATRIDLAVPGVVRALAFAPDGAQLIATGDSGIHVWDTSAGAREARPFKTVRWERGKGRAAIFTRRGALLVTASEEEGTVEFWDPARLGGCGTIGSLPPVIHDLALFSDNLAAVGYGTDPVAWTGKLCLHDLEHRCIARTFQTSAGAHAVGVSPDGRYVVAACGDSRVLLWEVASGRQILALEHGAHVNAVAFAPTGAILATAGRDGTV